jgi:MYXO-CTERM domain-containing protein
MKSAFLLTALLLGCVAEASSTTTAKNEGRIIDGVASTAEDDAAVWLGILTPEGYPQGSCSGVLIAENVVLTARHCVSRTTDGGIACKSDGTPIAGGGVRSNYPADQLAVVIGPTIGRDSRAAARGKQVFNTGATNLCNNDIAIVVLDRKIAGAKIAQLRLEAPPVKGEKILAVGYGVSNTYGRGRKRRADIPIMRVGPASSPTGGVAPNEFEIGEGICSGDSGGPAFSMTTGAVLGVVSRGGNGAPYDPMTDPPYTQCVDTAEYTTHNIYTRVDNFADMFAAAFEAAGTEPWLEGGIDPRKFKMGEVCAAADECRSGICAEGKCADPCSAGGTCGDGFTCTAGACVPTPPPTPAADPNKDIVKGGTCSMGHSGDASIVAMAGLLGVALLARRRRSTVDG